MTEEEVLLLNCVMYDPGLVTYKMSAIVATLRTIRDTLTGRARALLPRD